MKEGGRVTMRQEIPAWLFVVIVLVVVVAAIGFLWWRTGTQRTVISPETEQEWKQKLQKGYRMPQPSQPGGIGPYQPRR